MSTRIKEARQARGWSQQELAERVNVSQPTIVHWEQGTHIPRHLALARLADALGVSRQWLQGDGGIVDAATRTHSTIAQGSMTAADGYLSRPLHHIPLYAGPLDRTEIDACLRGERLASGYVPVALNIQSPIAIRADDPAIRREFPKGSVAIVECAERTLHDGKYYLFEVNGTARLRRWGATPMRLEADAAEDTQFVAVAPEVLGRVIMSIRNH